jgi:hypothetical protein
MSMSMTTREQWHGENVKINSDGVSEIHSRCSCGRTEEIRGEISRITASRANLMFCLTQWGPVLLEKSAVQVSQEVASLS